MELTFNFSPAKNLRSKIDMENSATGYYKWWCPSDSTFIEKITEKLGLTDENGKIPFESKEYGNQTYYCIYIGIAVNEPLKKRLDWHINDEHTKSKIEHRTLSTLRQSIAAIDDAGNMNRENEVNTIIDELYVEYITVNAADTQEAKSYIEDWERENLGNNKYFYPLNIRDNKHSMAKNSCQKLKTLRKNARNNALLEIKALLESESHE